MFIQLGLYHPWQRLLRRIEVATTHMRVRGGRGADLARRRPLAVVGPMGAHWPAPSGKDDNAAGIF